jgi:hypothetical protein
MRTLELEVVNVIWQTIEPLLADVDDSHPLGCHRPRVSDPVVFLGDLDSAHDRLVVGRHRSDLRPSGVRHALRARRDVWIAAGMFDRLQAEAIAAFDRIVVRDLSEVSLHHTVA